MKKLIVTLLALIMLLSCASALADVTPTVYEKEGISLKFEDVQEASPNYMNLVKFGIISREPFISCLYLDYYAMDIVRQAHIVPSEARDPLLQIQL